MNSVMGIVRRVLVSPLIAAGFLLVTYAVIIGCTAMWLLRGFRKDGTSRLDTGMNWAAEHLWTPVIRWSANR